jgi:hypothetical protein
MGRLSVYHWLFASLCTSRTGLRPRDEIHRTIAVDPVAFQDSYPIGTSAVSRGRPSVAGTTGSGDPRRTE